jgi:oligosaccharyl transferase (archaeosortase A-associated)
MCVVAGDWVMISINFKDKRTIFVIITVAILSIISLWVRILPSFSLGGTDLLIRVASDDPLYNLRQVEQILANFPNYAWFDPMTLFPVGSYLNWGPVFPMIIAIACLVVGATTRPEIIAIGLLIPPIMAAAMVPIMYYIGKICGDWKTGLLSALFITVVSGQYFNRSFYGYMDHHIAEVLFSSIFCLFYMYTLYREKDTKIVLTDIQTYKKTIYLSILTGITFLLGHFVMPTMILFAMIIAIFTIIQFLVDGVQGRSSEYLLVINTITFTVASIGVLLFGLKVSGISLISYSIGHVCAYFILIGITVVLYAIYVKYGKEDYSQAIKVIALSTGTLFIVVFGLSLFIPEIYYLFIGMPTNFFGQYAISNTIQEAMPWGFIQAWVTFNFGLILMAGGVLVMLYKNFKEEHPYFMFGLVWSLIILFSTWQHIRYEYYLVVPLVLVSAICVSYMLDLGLPNLTKLIVKVYRKEDPKVTGVEEKKKSKKDRRSSKKSGSTGSVDYILLSLVIITLLIGGLFTYVSFSRNYTGASLGTGVMNPDWKESLDWMRTNTPDTGVNYTEIYDPVTFKYPAQAYGVMSWWDYGHMITYIANRIPNANPFQQGVIGPNGSASFFIAPTESVANTVLDNDGTRYIMTDIEMDTGKFWAMATWYNETAGGSPYQVWMLSQKQTMDGGYDSAQYNTKDYYNTMMSRLHNFDGSLINPPVAYYVEYIDPSVSQAPYAVISNVVQASPAEVDAKVNEYNRQARSGYHATTISPLIVAATHKIPALQHYRLVHESPNGVFPQGVPDLKYVKTFEYVKGAHIKGEGLIQINITSNTGRNFIYQQESVNGEWIVPYSTTGNPYGVKAMSKYRAVSTGAEYDVPETAVMQGLAI